MSKKVGRIYEFDHFRVDAEEGLLWRDGEVVPLTPKAFEMLLMLVENHGHVVKKEELMERIWPDTFVEEANLTNNISLLRKILQGEGGEQHYIKTVPRRGYRFVANVRGTMADGLEAGSAEHVTGERPIADANVDRIAPARYGISLWVKVAAAVLVLVAIAVSVWLLYFRRTTPVLTNKDTILLADFINTTGDEVFDGALKQGLATQLEQSPFLSIVPDARVRETLRFMGRSPDERLTKEMAREICERQGVTVMLVGSISSLGSHYVIGLEVVNARTGDVIAREQTEAESKERVLQVLGRSVTSLRGKLGESLPSIKKFDAPLNQATTSSLEALKAFSLGIDYVNKSGKYLESIPFFKRAIELDPNFALAYARLSLAYYNSQQMELAVQYAQKAFDLRERVSEREKLYIISRYYSDATGEMDKAIETFELWKQTYPRDFTPFTNVSGRYLQVGEFQKAVENARASLRLNPTGAAANSNLGGALLRLNRFDEAQEAIVQALARNIDSTRMRADLYALAFVRGDMAVMQKQLDWAAGKPDEYEAFGWQGEAAAFSGKLRQAHEFYQHATELALKRNVKEVAARWAVIDALGAAAVGLCPRVKEGIDQALDIERARIPLGRGALALALCGELGQAQSLADESSKKYPKDTLVNTVGLPLISAAIALQHHDPTQAIQILQGVNSQTLAAPFWAAYLRGQAYLAKHQGAEAAAEFQKILDHRGWQPTSNLYSLAHLGLARAAALAGDTAKARKAYEDFFALCKDADADIPILIEAKKEYEKLK